MTFVRSSSCSRGEMGEEVGEEVLLPDQVYREPSHGGTLPRMLARGGKRGEGSTRLPVPNTLGVACKSELGRVNRAESEGYSSESSSGDVGRGEREYQKEMDIILRQLRGARRTRKGE